MADLIWLNVNNAYPGISKYSTRIMQTVSEILSPYKWITGEVHWTEYRALNRPGEYKQMIPISHRAAMI
jgi:hypothetical protein